jgi:gamma-glutamyltranspeptidase / glutathione hydrolase
MVSAAHPLAVEAGLAVLRQGGNAVDAAVAVQMVLGFVEPPESGVGGGGFLLYREESTGEMWVYDGRETAPEATAADRFLLPGGLPMPFWVAVVSGRSVGVPGLTAMLHLAHETHGLLPWAELFDPAIALAETGVPMPPRLQRQVARDPSLWLFSSLRRRFVLPAREETPTLSNPDLAATYRRIAGHGARSMSTGPTAQAIVSAASGRLIGSDLDRSDLKAYAPVVRKPVCGPYRQWTVCGPPPPSAGGIGLLQILGTLEHFAMARVTPGSLEAVHLLAEAGRLAHADFELVADPAFVAVDVQGLTDPSALAERAGRIDRARAASYPVPGTVERWMNEPFARRGPSDSGTSHFSIVDGQGNVAAVTCSIEAPFGSRIMVDGFLLNNQLTDFSFRPVHESSPVPNRVEPGKRPRSAMSPTIVLDADGSVRLVIGSRGGERIVGHVAKTVVAVLDWGLPIQESIALPNVVGLVDALEIEQGTVLERLKGELTAMGHRVSVRPMTSGLHGIESTPEGWRGGADPRLDGMARGD